MQLEGEVDTVKKALCVFLAIVFICCVFCYREDRRFSVSVWLDNLLSIGEGVTFQDIAEVWTQDYILIEHDYKGLKSLTKSVQGYDKNGELIKCKLAYTPTGGLQLGWIVDGKIYERWEVTWLKLYDADGDQLVNPLYDIQDVVDSGAVDRYYFFGHNATESASRKAAFEGAFPCILEQQVIYFGWYEGDNEVLEGLDSVIETFDRLIYTGKLVGKAFLQVFENVGDLLPWNATVGVT